MRRATVALLCCALLWACGGDDAKDPRPGDRIAWSKCGDIECATLQVPADHAQPRGPTIDLALARRRADGDRIGALLLNPGGPGAPGITFVEQADSIFSREVLDRFDIVAWDPRGTGASTAIDCGTRLDYFFEQDLSPDDAAEVRDNIVAARRFANACEAGSADLLPVLGSPQTVDDMDAIRVALGEPKLTYIGFSYGTYLGALYADKYPTHVRALVLDGAVDPTLDGVELTREQAMGFDSALAAFLDDCAHKDCAFGGDDPASAYQHLLAQIDAEPLPADVNGEERTLGPGEADIGIANALYFGTSGWDMLARALNRASRGDGSPLLKLSDEYTGRQTGGTYDNSQSAFFGTSCIDTPWPTMAQLPSVAASIERAAPAFGASTTWLTSPCSAWPIPAQGQPHAVHGAGAPPIIVIGTTNDPATPLKWAQSLSDQLDSARLIVHRGEGHTAYAQGNGCVDSAVNRYLIDLVPPRDGLVC